MCIHGGYVENFLYLCAIFYEYYSIFYDTYY